MRIFIALLCSGLSGPALAGQIVAADLASLPLADVVILGEVHDNPVHHTHQAQAVAALLPRALVFEMLTSDQAVKVTSDARADLKSLEAALGWEGSGWPDFGMYFPIFAAAPDAVIVGGALPRARIRRAIAEGAASVFGPEAARFGLAHPLAAEDQAAREALQQEAHCNALPPEILGGMVEAQRLRDAVLAQAVVRAVAQTGGPVAVITGTGHARVDEGIPAALALASPALRVLSVGQLEEDPGQDAPFDLWIVTEPVPRADPCAAFATQEP